MSGAIAVPFAGSPRPPTAIPLQRADEVGIRQVLDRSGIPNGNTPDPGLDRDDVVLMYRRCAL